ncbi:S1C family serine protease [Saccharibacillus kuerlensis]|uniref:Trypsin-like peptidase domain-containing protein n=1 Tax=Saccharibacillus kuerlensis TaxID=459527 RepID=A0ABQ2KZR1_9BACL|nr:trypsin-like peptidase domain-containing protein [Saccharibacillus kuerlensis]GGN98128.1 hypothetical protein GCM10010969_16790 [Saccharibacillus kuerlensis]
MKKGWIFSGLASLLVLAGTGGASWYVLEKVPEELKGAPVLAAAQMADKQAAAAKPDSPKPAALKDVINATQKKVVMIKLEDGSLGSGFLYNEQGDVITNAHVVEGARQVKVKTADARTLDGEVIGAGTETDIAVVRVPELAGQAPLQMAEVNGEIGDEVLALGSPLGLQNTVTTGIISGTGRDLTIDPYVYNNLYQISAPIAPGNSGGPLVDLRTGAVLGINSAKFTEESSIGFSIPVTEILDTVQGWSAKPGIDLPKLVSGKSADGEGVSNEGWSMTDDAEYLLSAYYISLSSKDYVTAYSFLGSSWQAGTDYNGFRDGYLKTGEIQINSIFSERSGQEVIVTITITAEEFKESGTVYTDYKLTYRVGYENDMLKIISGKGEKVA